jgi:NAD(P)-dependent dehydrogenase (short-subunit alcohol dehydrogenase family)
MSAYCASKAAVESLGDSLRVELRPTGARVGVAYYAELDTDMTARGFATEAAARTPLGGRGRLPVSPVEPAIDALERGIRRRSRRIASPAWVAAVLPFRELAQRLVELPIRPGLAKTLEIARSEHPPLTTPQPHRITPSRATDSGD